MKPTYADLEATIESLRAEVEDWKSQAKTVAKECAHKVDFIAHLKEILKGRDEALRNIASDKMYDCECNRQHWAKQALSKTWEEGEK